MTDRIPDLTSVTELTTGTLFPVWADGDTQKTSLATILVWLQANLTFTGLALSQQYAAPSASGFSVAIAAPDTWLILTPVAGYAAGTIVLPAAPDDQQIVQVNCTQSVSTLTVSGNGKTVTGAPTTLAANGFFTLRFDGTLDAWFRVG